MFANEKFKNSFRKCAHKSRNVVETGFVMQYAMQREELFVVKNWAIVWLSVTNKSLEWCSNDSTVYIVHSTHSHTHTHPWCTLFWNEIWMSHLSNTAHQNKVLVTSIFWQHVFSSRKAEFGIQCVGYASQFVWHTEWHYDRKDMILSLYFFSSSLAPNAKCESDFGAAVSCVFLFQF